MNGLRIVDAYQVKTSNNEFELFGAEMKLVTDKKKSCSCQVI